MKPQVKIDNIQPAFNKAHRKLWEIKNPDNIILKSHESTGIQGRWWMEEHNVLLYGDRLDSWTHAEFPSEEALTMFMLRWS